MREDRGRGWQSPTGAIQTKDPDGDDNPVCPGCPSPKADYVGFLFQVNHNGRITYQGARTATPSPKAKRSTY